MYNYQRFVQENRIKDKSESLRQSFSREVKSRKSTNLLMSKRQKKRLNAFVFATIQSPIKVDQYHSRAYEPRKPISPSTHSAINVKPWTIKAHTAVQRITDLQQQNSVYDTVPFSNASNHVFRDAPSQDLVKSLQNPSVRIRLHNLENNAAIFSYKQKKTNCQVKQTQKPQLYISIDISSSSCRFKTFTSSVGSNTLGMPKPIPKKKSAQPVRKMYFQSLKGMLVDQDSACTAEKSAKTQQVPLQTNQKQKQNESNVKNVSIQANYHLCSQLMIRGVQHQADNSTLKQSAVEALIRCNLLKKVGRKNCW